MLSIIAIVWIWQNALPGAVIGIAIGAYFLLLGAALAVLGSANFATIDIARGALTVLVGVLARRSIAARPAKS